MREIKQIAGPVGHLSIKVLKQSMPAAAPMQEPIVATVVLTHVFSYNEASFSISPPDVVSKKEPIRLIIVGFEALAPGARRADDRAQCGRSVTFAMFTGFAVSETRTERRCDLI